MLFVFIYTERQIGVKELPRNPQLVNNRPRHIPVASLLAQRLKRLPAMWETQVRSLGREDPLEKEMVPQSSILAWRIPWMDKPGGLPSMGLHRVGHD